MKACTRVWNPMITRHRRCPTSLLTQGGPTDSNSATRLSCSTRARPWSCRPNGVEGVDRSLQSADVGRQLGVQILMVPVLPLLVYHLILGHHRLVGHVEELRILLEQDILTALDAHFNSELNHPVVPLAPSEPDLAVEHDRQVEALDHPLMGAPVGAQESRIQRFFGVGE